MGPDGDVMVEESPPTTSQGRWCPRACAAGAKSRVLAPGTFLFVAHSSAFVLLAFSVCCRLSHVSSGIHAPSPVFCIL